MRKSEFNPKCNPKITGDLVNAGVKSQSCNDNLLIAPGLNTCDNKKKALIDQDGNLNKCIETNDNDRKKVLKEDSKVVNNTEKDSSLATGGLKYVEKEMQVIGVKGTDVSNDRAIVCKKGSKVDNSFYAYLVATRSTGELRKETLSIESKELDVSSIDPKLNSVNVK